MTLLLPRRAIARPERALIVTGVGTPITPGSTMTKVPGTTGDMYAGGGVTSGTAWRLVAPADGRYLLKANIPFEVSEAQEVEFGFVVNGTATGSERLRGFNPGASAEAVAHLSDSLDLSAGDYVEPFCRCTASGTASISVNLGIGLGLGMSRQAAAAAPVVNVENVVDTLLAGTSSWTSPVDLVGTDINVACWGGGQAGLTDTKAGDGTTCAVVDDTIAPNTAYTVAIGTGGGSAGAAGGDTTWRTNVCVAPGGASGTSAVGDTVNAGGTGASGVGAQTPGGSGGTSTAADASGNGGEPDGAGANTTSGAATYPGAGGRSTATLGVAGQDGFIRLGYQQTPDPAYPWVDSQSNGRNADNATEHTLPVPGTHKAGTVLLVVAAKDGAGSQMSLSNGATELADIASGTTAALGVWVLDSVDVPSLTLTSDSQIVDYAVLRLDNCAAAVNIDLTAAAVAAAANWTAPEHTHSGGSVAALWIVVHASDGSNGAAVPGKPTGYGQHTFWPAGDGPPNLGGASLQFSMRRATAATETPGLVSAGTRAGAAATICIPVAS